VSFSPTIQFGIGRIAESSAMVLAGVATRLLASQEDVNFLGLQNIYATLFIGTLSYQQP